MDASYKKLFSYIPEKEPSPRLRVIVVQRIEASQIRDLRLRAGAYGSLVVLALGAAIPSIQYLLRAFSESGFSQYASLIVSDGSYALAHWRELAFSITDSLPINAGMICIAVALVFIVSLKRAMTYRVSLKDHRRHARAALA